MPVHTTCRCGNVSVVGPDGTRGSGGDGEGANEQGSGGFGLRIVSRRGHRRDALPGWPG